MNTLHPVVILGSHFWNQELLPRDEFAERMRAVRVLMRSRGWDGLVVYGDCAEPGLLAWLTNVCPRMRWSIVLIGQEGEPTLVVPGALRDLPMTAVMTPVTDIRSSADMANILPQWAQALRANGKPRVALHGAKRMAPSVHAAATGALSGRAELEDAGGQAAALLQRVRVRETYLLRQGCTLLGEAADTFRTMVAKGSAPAKAALEAEKMARLKGAHDVRILLSLDQGRNMEPFLGMDFPSEEPSIAYVALRYLGYWTEAVVACAVLTPVQQAVNEALAEMIRSVKPGRTREEITAQGDARLQRFEPHRVFRRCQIRKMGLSLDEPALGHESEATLQTGALYSLSAAASAEIGAAASALVKPGEQCELLWRSA